jgi:hypothetical protein
MIAVGTAESPLDEYARETLQRLPLAAATLSLWAYVLQPRFLAQVFAQYRGRSFANTTGFCGHKRKPLIEEAIKKFCNQLG